MSLLLAPLIDIILGYSTRQLNILNLKLKSYCVHAVDMLSSLLI